MPSVCGRYSSAYLLALDLDECAGLLAPYFNSFPSKDGNAVRRYLRHAAEVGCGPDRPLIFARLLEAWAVAVATGLITSDRIGVASRHAATYETARVA